MSLPIVDYDTMDWARQRAERPVRATDSPKTDEQSASQAIGQPLEPVHVRAVIDEAPVSVLPIDWTLLGVTLALLGVGAVMVYSSSTVIAATKFDSPTFFMVRQLSRAALGLALLIGALYVPVDFLKRNVRLILVLAFLLLLVPPIMSQAYKGARSWIDLFGLSFQPSEVMKFALILFLAERLARQQERLSSFSNGLAPHLVIMAVPLGIIVLEPDLGTAVAITLIVGVIMVAAQVRARHLLLLALVASALVALLIWIEPYRIKRLGMNYQIDQGFVALGSGGVFGRGLGRSFQKFFFLPEPYTDSIFPIIGEELGLVGAVAVLGLFAAFGWRGIAVARRQPTLFGFLLAVGLTANIMVYASLNIAVMTGLIPTTGLPLPFISYGGSALVVNLALTGILLNLSRYHRGEKADSALPKGIG